MVVRSSVELLVRDCLQCCLGSRVQCWFTLKRWDIPKYLPTAIDSTTWAFTFALITDFCIANNSEKFRIIVVNFYFGGFPKSVNGKSNYLHYLVLPVKEAVLPTNWDMDPYKNEISTVYTSRLCSSLIIFLFNKNFNYFFISPQLILTLSKST